MGIRFLCPEGHKLHVKTFLAGKRAVCPKCGAKVVVPAESQSDSILAAVKGAESGVLPDLGITAPESAPLAAAPTAVEVSVAKVAVQMSVAVASTSTPDVLAEDPTAMWYVHHPSLGQFGPATAEVFRTWLSEGRVSGDSLVWRAGWAEWQSAMVTFPQLARAAEAAAPLAAAATATVPTNAPPAAKGQAVVARAAAPVIAPVVAAPVAATVAPVFAAPATPVGIPIGTSAPVFSSQPVAQTALPMGQVVAADGAYGGFAGGYAETNDSITSRSRRRRRKSNDTMMIASGILLALIVVLAIVLIVVLTQQSNPPQESSSPRPRAKAKSAAPAAVPQRKQNADMQVEPLDPEAGNGDMNSTDDQ